MNTMNFIGYSLIFTMFAVIVLLIYSEVENSNVSGCMILLLIILFSSILDNTENT